MGSKSIYLQKRLVASTGRTQSGYHFRNRLKGPNQPFFVLRMGSKGWE